MINPLVLRFLRCVVIYYLLYCLFSFDISCPTTYNCIQVIWELRSSVTVVVDVLTVQQTVPASRLNMLFISLWKNSTVPSSFKYLRTARSLGG